jgi:hypothetical protein
MKRRNLQHSASAQSVRAGHRWVEEWIWPLCQFSRLRSRARWMVLHRHAAWRKVCSPRSIAMYSIFIPPGSNDSFKTLLLKIPQAWAHFPCLGIFWWEKLGKVVRRGAGFWVMIACVGGTHFVCDLLAISWYTRVGGLHCAAVAYF